MYTYLIFFYPLIYFAIILFITLLTIFPNLSKLIYTL